MTAGRNRTYSAKEKAAAVASAVVNGNSEASRQTGIPEASIRHWKTLPEFAPLIETAREEVAEAYWVDIQLGLNRIRELIPTAKNLKDVAVTTAILTEKYQLLTGGATDRTEARDITGTLSDVDLIEAIREADRLTSGEGAAEPPPGEAAL